MSAPGITLAKKRHDFQFHVCHDISFICTMVIIICVGYHRVCDGYHHRSNGDNHVIDGISSWMWWLSWWLRYFIICAMGIINDLSVRMIWFSRIDPNKFRYLVRALRDKIKPWTKMELYEWKNISYSRLPNRRGYQNKQGSKIKKKNTAYLVIKFWLLSLFYCRKNTRYHLYHHATSKSNFLLFLQWFLI